MRTTRQPPIAWLLFLLTAFAPAVGVAQESSFRRGDGNGDGVVDSADAISVLLTVFGAAPRPCADAFDVNDDGSINVSDPVALLRHLFRGAPAPPAPSGECGPDPSEDALGCESYPPCVPDLAVCLTEELLREALGELPEISFCLPAGLLEVPVGDVLSVLVCPEDEAPACGDAGTPGCAIEISSITPLFDFEQQNIGLRLEGRVDDLPIDLDGGFLSATCLLDIGGADWTESPFSFDLVFPLVTREVEPGVFEIEAVGDGVVDNVDMVFETSGGIVCSLVAAGRDLFLNLLLEPLETVGQDLSAQLPDTVVGLRICP